MTILLVTMYLLALFIVKSAYCISAICQYFKVKNIHDFSAEKGVLNFRVLIVHCWLSSHEYIESGHPLSTI